MRVYERHRLRKAIQYFLHNQVVIIRNGNVVEEGLLRWDIGRLCFIVNGLEFCHDQLVAIECNKILLTE